jgi:hypothetical protein
LDQLSEKPPRRANAPLPIHADIEGQRNEYKLSQRLAGSSYQMVGDPRGGEIDKIVAEGVGGP